MPARFSIVDSQGAAVDLAELVSAQTAVFLDAGEVSNDVFDMPLLAGGLRLRSEQVLVCTDFHPSASSHTEREMEVDEAEGATE
jgi:hypothetical protein